MINKFEQSIRAYTMNNALACFEDDILKAEVVYTIIGGKVVFGKKHHLP